MRANKQASPKVREWKVAFRDANLSVVSPAPRDVWWRLLEADPNALITQTPDWLDCICDLGDYEDASCLYHSSDGRELVLPLVRRRALPRQLTVFASLPPSWGFGGIVTAENARPAHVAAVFADLAGRSGLRTSLRPNPLYAGLWAAARPPQALIVPRLAHVLDLDGGFSTVWKRRFTGSARTAVRKAERMGVVVERDTSGKLVPVFYELFRRSLDRWALRQHEPQWLALWRGQRRDPVRKFEAMVRRLAGGCRFWVAWVDGQAAAAILVLQGTNAHYTRGAMNQEIAGPVRANDLLHRMAIEEACEEGCRHYHMGETGTSAMLARFKERFGAEPHPYHEYHLERFPVTSAVEHVRQAVKRTIGFRELT